MVLFSLLFQAKWSFAVTADANVMQHIRRMKSDEITILHHDCNELQQQIRKCRYAKVVSPKPESSFDDRTDKPDRQNSQRSQQITFKSREEKLKKLRDLQNELVKLQQNISDLEANEISILVPIFTLPFRIGQFGRLGINKYTEQKFRIISIVDENNSIVEFDIGSFYERHNSLGMGVGRPTPILKTVWLRNVSTAGLVDRSKVTPPPFLIITGTQDYENPIGAKQTVYVFEPLTIDPNDL